MPQRETEHNIHSHPTHPTFAASAFSSIQQANETYAQRFDPSTIPAHPFLDLVLLTCMDFRLDPARILGFDHGSAYVVRTAGARLEPVECDVVLPMVLGMARTALIMGHTSCLVTCTHQEFQAKLAQATPPHVAESDSLPSVENWQSLCDFPVITDQEAQLRADAKKLFEHPALFHQRPHITVGAAIYSLTTGRVTDVALFEGSASATR